MVAGLTCPGVQRQPTLAGSKMMGYSRTMCGPIVCMYPVPGTGFRSADPAEGIPHQVPEAVEVEPCPHECVRLVPEAVVEVHGGHAAGRRPVRLDGEVGCGALDQAGSMMRATVQGSWTGEDSKPDVTL